MNALNQFVCCALFAAVLALSSDVRGADEPAKVPETFKVKFETSKGNFVIEVTRKWAPLGADQFHKAVTAGSSAPSKDSWCSSESMVIRKCRRNGLTQKSRTTRSSNRTNAVTSVSPPVGRIRERRRCLSTSVTMRDSTTLASHHSARWLKECRLSIPYTTATAKVHQPETAPAKAAYRAKGTSISSKTFPSSTTLRRRQS